jgi:hypothetical protein
MKSEASAERAGKFLVIRYVAPDLVNFVLACFSAYGQRPNAMVLDRSTRFHGIA